MNRLAIAAAAMLVLNVAHAERIYKCVDENGNAVFSQTQCSTAAQSLNVEVSRPNESDTRASQERWDTVIQQQDAVRAARNTAAAERARAAQAQIEGAARQKDMQRELSDLQSRQRLELGCRGGRGAQDRACAQAAAKHGRADFRAAHGLPPEPASRTSQASRTTGPVQKQNRGAINPRTGEFYAPAGDGYVSTRNGTYFTSAGPNGVINTRTGEFVPTH